ncbi:MAG TPA: 4a-hydroxytetrahydrobiopterin dehydratase [Acidimicrobiales bacterium]|jgi:4a-hydroxytetrahydrobiopterin dehydratase|nr:4a-hydroxytetrahydrobiopterin dehydratase [Acidimicrobiales bacterium]
MPRPRLTDEQIEQALLASHWTREGDEIVRQVKRPDFKAAMAFVNQVADLAESLDHHPDIAISWNTVDLRVSTHDSGGLTDLDFELAKGVDVLDGSE